MLSDTRRHARLSLRLLPIAVVCALALPASVLGDPANGTDASPEPTRAYIVVLEDSVAHPGRVAQRHAVNRDADLSHVYKTAIEGYAAELTPANKAAIEADPNVAFVERDMPVELYSQETPNGLKRVYAPNNASLDIDGLDDVQVNADVAIIDSGIDYDHPDLRVVERTNCSEKGGSLSCVNNTGDDALGHGTHVAGTVGAIDNGFGVVGVAPGARLWSVKVIDGDNQATTNEILAGVDWVTARAGQIEVANMSLGWEGSCSSGSAIGLAIGASIDAGVLYAVAAGNETLDVAGIPAINAPSHVPGCLTDPITVSALSDYDGQPGSLASLPPTSEGCKPVKDAPFTDVDDTLAAFSNWGTTVDMTAPGTCIRSTYKHGAYRLMSGTSMASPHVAGAAAILASVENPSNRGDVMSIRSKLLANGNSNWTDDGASRDFKTGQVKYGPDGVKEPLLDVGNAGVFKVTNPGSVGSIGVTSHVSGHIDLYARNGNNEIWHKGYSPPPGQWGGWYTEPLPAGKPIYGAPAAGSRNSLSRDLFVRDHDGYLYFRNFYAGTWSPWFWIPGPHEGKILDSPAVTDRPDRDNGLDVVVRAENNRIYFKEYTDPEEWTDWKGMGEPPPGTASSPATAVHKGQHWHIMVRGNDGAIWDRAWTEGLGWTDWISLGGITTSAPALTSTQSGNDLYLFARGTDDAIWMRKLPAVGSWTPWESLGGKWVSDPAATSMESHGVSVFASGLDNKIQERRFLYGGWTNWMRIDDDCPPGGCTWNPGGPGTAKPHSVESNDLVTVDASGTANVFGGWEEGIDLTEPVKSLEGQLDPALLDGKGHYLLDVADVDDNGNSDLITVKDDGKVLVHPGQEDRTLGAALDTGISLPPVMNGAGNNEPIAVADVTGDGFGDLVAFVGLGLGSMKVYKGQSDGKFSTSPVSSLSLNSALRDGTGHYFLDVIDVDGDGRADLVSMETGSSAEVFRGQADGTFAAATGGGVPDPIMNDGVGHEPVGLGDVNADGMADLVTLDGSTLKLWTGKADGAFSSSVTAYGSSVDSSLLDDTGKELLGLLDYDGDGRSDLVAADDSGDLSAYRAQSDGKFADPVVAGGDIISVRRDETGHEFAIQKPFFRRAQCVSDGCPWPPVGPAESDVNADGRSDLVTLHSSGTAYVYRGTDNAIAVTAPGTSFEGTMDPALYDGSGHYVIDVADVNADRRADFVTQTDDGTVFVHPGKLDRTFAAGVEAYTVDEGLQDVEPIAVADVDADGYPDLVQAAVEDDEGLILVVPGTAAGTFSGEDEEISLQGVVDSALFDGAGQYFLDAIDVDGDERADLVSMTAGTVRVHKGQPSGEFSAPIAAANVDPVMDNGSGKEPVGLGDVTGDGRADLLALDSNGVLKLYAGKADATFGNPATPYSGTIDSSLMDGTGHDLIGLLDHNRDGRADLLSVDAKGRVSVYTSLSNNTLSSPGVLSGGSIPSNRFGRSNAHQMATAKPFLRRAGCAPSGCNWPPAPAESESADWSPLRASEASSGLDDLWCEPESSYECVAVGDAVTDAGVSRAQLAVPGEGTWNRSWPLSISEAPSSELSGIACESVPACFAVGSYDDGGGAHHALVLDWNGSAGSIVTPPLPFGARSSELTDISCIQLTMCMAVGSYVDLFSSVEQTLALLWDGTSWSDVSVPGTNSIPLLPSGSLAVVSSQLNGVSCPTATLCTSVGSYVDQSSGARKGLALEWDGTSWAAVATPDMQSQTPRDLTDVSCWSGEECVAVGSRGNDEAWVMSTDGSGWSTDSTPELLGRTGLSAVSCESSSTCHAAGISEDQSQAHPLVLAWDGSGWSEQWVEPPGSGASAEFSALSCLATECTAVGTVSYGNSRDANLAYHGIEGSWWPADTGGAGGTMRGVACTGGLSCLAIGDSVQSSESGDSALSWLLSGEEWSAAKGAEGSWPVLEDVSCTAASQCVAVGQRSEGYLRKTLIKRWSGQEWTTQSSPTPSNASGALALAGASCAPTGTCSAVGSYWDSKAQRTLPLAEHWNGSSWALVSVPTPGTPNSAHLQDVSCRSSSSCFAVGSYRVTISSAPQPLLEAWNGSSWSLQSPPLPSGTVAAWLDGVSCTESSACTAVGTYKTSSAGPHHPLILRWNGSAWSLQSGAEPPEFSGVDLRGISCYAATACVAVGSGTPSSGGGSVAIVSRWDGSSWALETTPAPSGNASNRLDAVSCAAADDCVATGSTSYDTGYVDQLILVKQE